MHVAPLCTSPDDERRSPEASQTLYEAARRDLEAIKHSQALIRASLERCEAELSPYQQMNVGRLK